MFILITRILSTQAVPENPKSPSPEPAGMRLASGTSKSRVCNTSLLAAGVLRALGLAVGLAAATAPAQTSSFTYQGRLTDNGAPANGIYDLQFSLFNVDSGGAPLAGPLTRTPLAVSNGLFLVMLDFGATNFGGGDRWLQIGVRPNGNPAPYTLLTPRQPITSAPYAITAANLSSVVAGDATFTGTVSFAPASGAPFLVGGTNKVVNLNADLLDGLEAGDFLLSRGGILTGSLTNNSGTNADSIFSESGIDRPATNAQTFAITNSSSGAMALLVKNEVRSGPGTAVAPAFSFVANTNTGVFNPGSNALAFATAGSERLRISTNGNVGIGTSTPSAKLDVAGNVSIGGFLALSNSALTVGINTTISPASSFIQLSASTVVTLNATTAISDAPVAGALLILQGSSDINTITVPDNANTRLGGSRILGDRDTLTLIFNGTEWVEISYANN
jgi:hypothetical protein